MMQHLTNEKLIDYIHGALTPQEDASVYSHIEQCAACRSEHDAEVAIGEELRSYASASERELPPTVKAEIWARVRAGRPSVWSRFATGFRPAIALPIAAVFAAGLYFGTASLGSKGGPTIEAAYYLQDHAQMNGTVPFSDHSVMPTDMESAASTNEQTPVAIEAVTYTADARR
jgi:predicted anti-sigma-YlaC factor YlaD